MKKHNCLLLILVITCSVAARAQVEPKPTVESHAQTPAHAQVQPAKQHHPASSQSRWSFGLLAGPALPVGQYGRYIFDNRNVSPVKTGALLELSGTYQVNRSFGITLVANGQINHIKDRPSDVVPTIPSNAPYVPLPYDNWWKIARLMAGGTYTLPLNESRKFDWIARVLVGVQRSKTAGFTAGYANDPNDPAPYYAIALPWAFTYQGDIGFKWNAGGRLALIAYAGYNGSVSRYSFTYLEQVETMLYTTTLGPTPITVEHKTRLSTSSLLLRAGMSWDL
ncbi:MAG TPA: hypothetical protein VGS79_18555 [Puia sp.]|nr:hypothetical protein [Puia sp.]